MKINYLCVPIGKTLIYPRLLKLYDVMKLIIRKEAIIWRISIWRIAFHIQS